MATIRQIRAEFDYLDAHVTGKGWNREHVARFIREHDKAGGNWATLVHAANRAGISPDLLALGAAYILNQPTHQPGTTGTRTTLTGGTITAHT